MSRRMLVQSGRGCRYPAQQAPALSLYFTVVTVGVEPLAGYLRQSSPSLSVRHLRLKCVVDKHVQSYFSTRRLSDTKHAQCCCREACAQGPTSTLSPCSEETGF